MNHLKESVKRVSTYLVLGFAITALLVSGKILTEDTAVGYRVELFAFRVLDSILAPFSTSQELPVVVVDVSKIKESDQQLADLSRLKEMIGAIAEQKPRAIAVALVLTPEKSDSTKQDGAGKTLTQQATEYISFLDFCLNLKAEKKIPIFLAVGSRTGGDPDVWLGQEKYKELAATVLNKDGDMSRILIWLKPGATERLFSLSASLARAYRKPHLPNALSWTIETIDEPLPGVERHLEEDVAYADAIVNYGKLEEIRQTTLLTLSGNSINEASKKFRDKMVLLGDATLENAMDVFTPPGQGQPQPGIYLHACAAYTLAQAPLYEIKLIPRLALDACLTFLMFGTVALSLYQRDDNNLARSAGNRRAFYVLISATAILLPAGVAIVYWQGLLWLDFLLLIIAMWLLPVIARRVPFMSRPRHVQAESSSIDAGPKDKEATNNKRKILFIAANPTDASRIQTDREHRIIKAEIERGRHRDVFEFLPPQFAVTITELLRAMNAKPNIVHFSGHGSDGGGITITNDNNQSQVINEDILKRLFKPLIGATEIVVLNSCYSAAQAESISRLGMYVVGNNAPIGDDGAISFSKGLYNALGEGKSFADAVNDGLIVVMTEAPSYAAVVEMWRDGVKLET